MSKYFIYARKSSEAEDRQILSIDSQAIELKRFAVQKGIRIVEILTEAKSAKAPGVRPVFNSMMDRLYRGEADGILCWKLDRLARNPVDGGAIIWSMKQHDVKIITPIQTFSQAEDNVVWMYLEFGMAQKYVDDLSRNVKRGLKTKAEMGWYPGPTPAGYLNRTHPDGRKTIAKDSKRFPIIRKCWELMLTGNYNPSEVWSIANTVLGFRTIKGNPMATSTIYNIFRSRFYVGTYEYPKGSGIWHTGRHLPMVTQEEFDRVQTLVNRGRKWPKNRKMFAFTGLIRCGACDRAVTGDEKHQLICSQCKFKFAHLSKLQCPRCKTLIADMKNPTRLHYIYYHCTGPSKGLCSERSIAMESLVEQIDGFLQKTRLPLLHNYWMQNRIEGGARENVISRMRQTLNQGKPEEQRQIVMAVASNLRLKDRRLCLDLNIPFEFDASLALYENAFVDEPVKQEMSRA
jgi:site-specific DNA recombinase